jgi:hypothetical protein
MKGVNADPPIQRGNIMDEFMLLIRGYDASVTPEQLQQRMTTYRPWMEKMAAEGRYKGGAPLDPTAGRLLMKSTNTVLTDGPFLESKEIIGGYVTLLAKDLDEALELARECPLSDHYAVEVRKVGKM